MTCSKTREPAVAGLFYPSQAETLRAEVRGLIDSAKPRRQPAQPQAIIAPHAGYLYSGAIAGSAYQSLLHAPRSIQRVVLLGPSHHVAFAGLALSHYSRFRTPLGDVPIDTAAIHQIESLPQVQFLEAAHAREHSLEVQLPFLQVTLAAFSIVPLVVGTAAPEAVAEVLALIWNAETLIVVSSDLSHYLAYRAACMVDADTCRKIEQLDYAHLQREEACGAQAIAGLLHEASNRGLCATTLDLRNSGDTAGSKDRVVGYGAWSFHAATGQ